MYTSLTDLTPSIGLHEYVLSGIACARSESFFSTSSIWVKNSPRNPAGLRLSPGGFGPAHAVCKNQHAATAAIAMERFIIECLLSTIVYF
ncbi:MAG: hypothetical protein AUI33_06035 [Ignavibacteria bacterium 13_1_40CM_2_61_4]|nr:MAG: hypothetical protein AUI33_06035 [Ignavibacteria bacterium 13_1_40CM_2_61_4]